MIPGLALAVSLTLQTPSGPRVVPIPASITAQDARNDHRFTLFLDKIPQKFLVHRETAHYICNLWLDGGGVSCTLNKWECPCYNAWGFYAPRWVWARSVPSTGSITR